MVGLFVGLGVGFFVGLLVGFSVCISIGRFVGLIEGPEEVGSDVGIRSRGTYILSLSVGL